MNFLTPSSETALPLRSQPIEGESGLGLCLRVAERHGVNFHTLRRLLKLNEKHIFNQLDSRSLALTMQVDLDWLMASLPPKAGIREFDWMGHRWFRTLDHRFSTPQVCPACVNIDGWIKAAWDLSLSTVCTKHHCNLVDCCHQCNESLRWNRPGLGLGHCGHVIKQPDQDQEVSQFLFDFQDALEKRLIHKTEPGSSQQLELVFGRVMASTSLAGLACFIEAFGIKEKPSLTHKGSLSKHLTTKQRQAVVLRAYERLSAVQNFDDFRDKKWRLLALEAPLMRMSRHIAHPGDVDLGLMLMDFIFDSAPTYRDSGRHQHLSQMRMF